MANKLYTFCTALNHGLERLLAALGLSMALLVVGQVFCRYILNNSLFWSEELARYMLVWLSFIGATVAYFRHLHPGVDIFTARFSPAGQHLAHRLTHLVTMALALVMIISGCRFAWFVRMQISPALAIPKWIILAIIPASGLVLFAFALTFFLFPEKQE